MRKFRNAALAVATATTVAISGVSVAAAEDTQTPPATEKPSAAGSSELKDKIVKGLQLDQQATGDQLFGQKNWKNDEKIKAATPMWAKIADSLFITTAAISVFGLVVAPIYNFLRYGINR
ncbi:hypothetical protein HMPREF2678_05260 [Corynebacterium sp. HMSC058E07]|uniref:hypothetical protein n=1 Tax=Corynebacterium sp. HMSC058E07 TaxID=1715157 RepID=UPI0008A4F536|nr:hypothetical protein [Corynebacterium sp. HMSC058E07]OFM59888.1 hypothetical protein HMPREF2678_05260 [Corynebacterium sp. HMSC058E07]